jgi:hypothetical protein
MDPEFSGFDESSQLLQARPIRFDQEPRGPNTKTSSLFLQGRSLGGLCADEKTILPQAFEKAKTGVATNVFNDDVHIPDRFRWIGCGIVEDIIGTEFAQEGVLLTASCGGDMSAKGFGDLDCQVTGPSCAGIHQDAVTHLDPSHLDQHLPCRKPRERETRRGFMGEGRGFESEMPPWSANILSISPGFSGDQGIPKTSSPGLNRVTP